jgi:superfamily II DNA/RNA helicase
MPRDVENYVHRIGRTGRAGKTGAAITFWNKNYDVACAPALAKIAREAEQVVPPWLDEWALKAAKAKKDKNWSY